MHPLLILTGSLAALWIGLGVPGQRASERAALVVGVSGTEHRLGQVIAEGTSLHVPEGARIDLVVAPENELLPIVGPYEGALRWSGSRGQVGHQEAGWRLLPALKAAFGAGLAAVRSGDSARPPDSWMLDITGGGDKCVRQGQTPTLWHAAPNVGLVIAVTHLGLDREQSISWPRGSETQPWPREIPVEDGAEYAIAVPALIRQVTFTVRVVPEPAEPAARRIERFLDLGCRGQALLEIEHLPTAALAR